MLKKEHREQLRASLCSYFGHFLHASSFRLKRSIFSRFAWLNAIFELRSADVDSQELLPLWQPPQVSSFRSQWLWFHHRFGGVIQLIQLGRVFACIAPDIKRLPAGVQQIMKAGNPVAGFDALLAPLAALNGVRAQLRLAHLFVAEEGYLPQGTLSAASGIHLVPQGHLVRGGMKRRVLRLLWQPVLN